MIIKDFKISEKESPREISVSGTVLLKRTGKYFEVPITIKMNYKRSIGSRKYYKGYYTLITKFNENAERVYKNWQPWTSGALLKYDEFKF